MLYIILQFISLCILFKHYVSSYILTQTGQTIFAYGVCVLLAIAIILCYKIRIVGHMVKVIASASMSYILIRIMNWFITGFVQDNNLLFADLIVLVIGTVIFSKITFEQTENTWLESDSGLNYYQMKQIKEFFSIKKSKKPSSAKSNNFFLRKQNSLNELNSLKEKLDYYEKNDFALKNDVLQLENESLKSELAQQKTKYQEIRSTLEMSQRDNTSLKNEIDRIKSQSSKNIKDVFFINCQNEHDIKERYRKLSSIYHPDCSCGDSKIFLQIKERYEEIC